MGNVTTMPQKERVFVIEDNHKYVELITRALISDYNVSCTDSAEKGLEVCKAFLPNIILLDINLTGNQSGIDLLKSIKGDETLAHLPVLIMSGISSSEIISDSLEYGANDYLVKPFDIKHLTYKMKNLLAISEYAKRKKVDVTTISDAQQIKPKHNLIKQIEDLDDEAILKSKMSNLVDLSKRLGISQSTINRAIQKNLGMSPNNFLVKRRLEKAKLLVISSQWKQVGEIAHEMGFATSSYFCNCFKKHFGCSPSEMRAR